MTTTEIDSRNLAAIEDAYGEVQLALDLQHAKLDRLIDRAFENKERATRSMLALTRGYGAEETIRLLEDKGWLARAHYFGFLRGSMFARAAREEATRALTELPNAIREREVLMIKRDDLLRTRQHVLERVDRVRLDASRPAFAHERPTGRQRN